MSGLPDITMTGTLTADPELRFAPSGTAVAHFTVACNKKQKNRDTGEWEDKDKCFLRCTVFNQVAENVAESLSKGQRVMVSGELKQRSYETKEGEKRTVFEVTAFEVAPSLRYATADVRKVKRSGAEDSQWEPSPASDPWATSGGQGSQWDEPPF